MTSALSERNPRKPTLVDDSTSSRSSAFSLGISRELSRELCSIQAWNDWRSSLPLVAMDVLVATSVWLFTLGLTGILGVGGPFIAWQLSAFSIVLLIFSHKVSGLYPGCGLDQYVEFDRILRSSCLTVFSVFGSILVFGVGGWAYVELTVFGLSLPFAMISARLMARATLAKFDWWCQPVLVIGDERASVDLYERLCRSRREGLRPLGMTYNPASEWASDRPEEHFYIGPLSDVGSILLNQRASRIAIPPRIGSKSVDFRYFRGIPEVMLASSQTSLPTMHSRVVDRQGRLEIHCSEMLNRRWNVFLKRCMDLGLILLASPLLLPIILVSMFLVRIGSKGPIFYRQVRIGKDGARFHAWKFRSMVEDADAVLEKHLSANPSLKAEWERDHKLRNDPRITSIGKWLRKTSLDELPQLWNVVRGEMSLVGPRPIVEKEIEKYRDIFELYLLVPPGITGLWQISGRNNTTYDERLNFDRIYVENWSCTLDLFILFRTIKTALFQEGAY